MELNRDEIIKALECCFSNSSCDGCPYTERVDCIRELKRNAIPLIKEITEENERLRAENDELCDNIACLEIDKENAERRTVRKMHSEIEARCIKGGIYPAFVKRTIDNVAEEMLEGE